MHTWSKNIYKNISIILVYLLCWCKERKVSLLGQCRKRMDEVMNFAFVGPVNEDMNGWNGEFMNWVSQWMKALWMKGEYVHQLGQWMKAFMDGTMNSCICWTNDSSTYEWNYEFTFLFCVHEWSDTLILLVDLKVNACMERGNAKGGYEWLKGGWSEWNGALLLNAFLLSMMPQAAIYRN